MPELPEVETITRGLRTLVVGRRIARVKVALPKIAVAPKGVNFRRALIGEAITAVRRRGKYVVMELTSGRFLVTSLRMTGRLIFQRHPRPVDPYTHVRLDFEDFSRLCFADSRQFGRMRLVEPDEPWESELGIEPLSQHFTPQRFIGMLSGRRVPVKVFLLNQRRIAGIGNIYACEALWEARIRPTTRAKALKAPAVRRLHTALIDVLHRAIEMRGTSVDDYVDADGLRGGFQNQLSVYGRHGKACARCGKPLVRTVLGGRGTWWCRRCQK